VDNAGISKPTSWIEGTTTLQNFDEVFDVNVKSLMDMVIKAQPYLLKSRGNIINMSSIVAHKPGVPGFTFYCMSKAVVETLTKTMAQEFGPRGLRVNAIAPAVIKSRLHERGGFIPDGMPEKDYYGYARVLHPLARVGLPADVANAAAFLASDQASFISGHTILVDGGCNVHSFTTATFGAIMNALKADQVI